MSRQYVEVEEGDTLSSIAEEYLGSADRWPDLARANPKLIYNPDHIEVGWQLRLPDDLGDQGASRSLAAKTVGAPSSKYNMVFPPGWMITSPFGWRGPWGPPVNAPRHLHTGIDIAGFPEDTIVEAARSGRVIYAGDAGDGYGIKVVIEHEDGWKTMYAHLSILQCQAGWDLQWGDVVGGAGSTGMSTGVHLHFEIIDPTGSPVDPEPLLRISDGLD